MRMQHPTLSWRGLQRSAADACALGWDVQYPDTRHDRILDVASPEPQGLAAREPLGVPPPLAAHPQELLALFQVIESLGLPDNASRLQMLRDLIGQPTAQHLSEPLDIGPLL